MNSMTVMLDSEESLEFQINIIVECVNNPHDFSDELRIITTMTLEGVIQNLMPA